jgi:hypothetical protein
MQHERGGQRHSEHQETNGIPIECVELDDEHAADQQRPGERECRFLDDERRAQAPWDAGAGTHRDPQHDHQQTARYVPSERRDTPQ